MRGRGIGTVGAAALLALAGAARAQSPEAQPLHPPPAQMETGRATEGEVARGVTLIRAGRLVDPVSGGVSPASLLIRDGRVVAVGALDAPAPAGAQVVDLSRETVLPGLIDVHVHLTAEPDEAGPKALTVSVPEEALNGVANARRTLLAGFTTARNVGASHYTDVALREAIDAGKVIGPRLQVSGPPLGAVGGHADENLLPPEFHYEDEGVATGPWALREKVRTNFKYGADLIKFMATGGVLSHGDSVGGQQLSQEEMDAIVTEAHLWGRKVAVHAHGTSGINAALRAGADSIEHCSFIDDEGLRLAKQHGAYLDFDIYNDDFIMNEGPKVGIEPASLAKEHQVGVIQRENFRRAVQAGEKMAFATDAGVYPHGDNAKQFHYMVTYGMTPMQAIQAATVAGADLMGLNGKAGCLHAGCYADVIAVGQDPLAHVEALEHVDFVMKGGVVYKAAGLVNGAAGG
jgi:imidazolonepropionase-like amidohydrolase